MKRMAFIPLNKELKMKVYQVNYDVDNYQSFMHNCSDEDLVTVFSFDGIPKNKEWKQPEGLYISNPMNEKGDFYHLGGQIALNQKAFLVLKPVLEACCELLPFTFEGDNYYAMNVLNVIDCYDYEKGEYDYMEEGSTKKENIWGVQKYAFNPQNFNDKSIFKDDIFKSRIFTYEGFLSDPEKEFKYLYEKNGLKGLRFRLLWDSEKDC